MLTHTGNNIPRQQVTVQSSLTQRVYSQWLTMQYRTHRLIQSQLSQFQYAINTGNSFKASVVAAVTAFAIRICTGMANFNQELLLPA